MNDTQAAIQQVTKQIADLEARRAALHNTQRKARATVQEQEAVLYGELIGGGAADRPLETVTREKARDEAINQAQKELDAQIAQLRAEREKILREIAIAEYEQTCADIRKTLFTCIGQLYKFNAAIGAVPEFGPPQNYKPTAEAQLAKNMLEQLRGLDLYRALIELERIAPDFMAQARKIERIK